MAKVSKNTETNPGDPAPAKKTHGKPSYFSRLFPFLDELRTDADAKYKAARFDEHTTDVELDKRNELRKVLADFPTQKG
jgi:hypothetical protein